MKQIHKFYILFLSLLIISTSNSLSQGDLREDSVFFKSKKEETNNWLNKTGIRQLFTLHDIKVKKNSLQLKFKSSLKTADSTITAWNLLKWQYDSIDNKGLARYLFNSMAFEMEIGKDSLELTLTSQLEDFTITIKYDKKDGIMLNEDTYLIPSRTFKTITIKMDELSLISGSSNITNDKLTIKQIRQKLSDFLKAYYKPKGTFWLDSHLEMLSDRNNELTFEVTQLSKEILNDRNYFELIRYEIKVIKRDNNFEIKYQIQGKYSGGFGFAPRRSEYRNMEPDYSDYLIRYESKFVQMINNLLTN